MYRRAERPAALTVAWVLKGRTSVYIGLWSKVAECVQGVRGRWEPYCGFYLRHPQTETYLLTVCIRAFAHLVNICMSVCKMRFSGVEVFRVLLMWMVSSCPRWTGWIKFWTYWFDSIHGGSACRVTWWLNLALSRCGGAEESSRLAWKWSAITCDNFVCQ